MKISFCGILTIVFIILKLTGVIGWSWLWVAGPVWIPAVVAIIIFVLAVLVQKIKGE